MSEGPRTFEDMNLEEVDPNQIEALELLWDGLSESQRRLFVKACPEKVNRFFRRRYDEE